MQGGTTGAVLGVLSAAMSPQGASVPLMPHGCAGEPLPKDWGAKGGVQGEGLGLRGRFPTQSSD